MKGGRRAGSGRRKILGKQSIESPATEKNLYALVVGRSPKQEVIARLGGDWQARELEYDPRLRDSKGHLKTAEIRRLDRAAS